VSGGYFVASIYRRGRDGSKKGAPYWVAYIDHNGRKRTRRGFTDKGLTEQLANKIENEVRKRKLGLIDPQEEQLADFRRLPIVQHLDEFEQHLKTKANTGKHVKLTMTRIRRLVEVSNVRTTAELSKLTVEKGLDKLRQEEDLGNRTFNHYVQALDSFCRWMVGNQRMVLNPLAGMMRMNNEVDVRHKRRSLEPEQMIRLIETTRASDETIQGYSGELRARTYLLSYLTGLRRKEIASLTPASFSLELDPPTVTVAAACSKHRRTDILPLHEHLVAELRDWLREMQPQDKLFPNLDRKKTWLMVKKDLERIGIPYETTDGIADFHASGRHTYITELLRSGASLPEAKELARHSDVKMTMRYTHIGLADQAAALAGLRTGKSTVRLLPQTEETLPVTEENGEQVPADLAEAWQYIGRTLAVLQGLLESSDDTLMSQQADAQKRKKPGKTGPFDADCHSDVTDDTEVKKWRRRESNPFRLSLPISATR